MNQYITAIVLAAGMGRRMHSSLPKSLHPVAGQPILSRILKTLKQTGVNEIRLVINKEHKELMQPIADVFRAKMYFQGEKKGTAIAVLSAQIDELTGHVLIVNGDHPLISVSDLKNIIDTGQKKSVDLCVGSCVKKDPGDYGRIIRQGKNIVAIVEKDSLPPEWEKVTEINAGIYLVKSECLKAYLYRTDMEFTPSALRSPLVGSLQKPQSLNKINTPRIKNQNPKREYGFTNIVSIAIEEGKKVITCLVSEDSAFGTNTQRELAFATKKIFTRKLNQLMSQGVIIVDPLNTYIEESVQVGQGCVIYPGVYLKGRTSIAPFCAIETNSFITDSVIHQFVLIRSGSYIESAEVGNQSVIGPYARLRPGTKIGEQCRVGNFVEMKKTHFGARSKASHLSYLGDAEVGEEVNIGCGTVTCNLNIDGKKYVTRIGDKVFVGSGTKIVAPVQVGDEAATGAGSVITKDVPSQALAIGRSSQNNKENYFKPRKVSKHEN
ncbi:MAG: NTP transferase domain-containing protein [Bdellovibrionales bacterium]|nr:NTP transferase domain-containing protein [Bdellovibrionales bacterium]